MMRIQWKLMLLVPIVELVTFTSPASAQFGRWYMPQAIQNPGLMNGRNLMPGSFAAGQTPSLPVAGSSPFSSGGAPPIGTTQQFGVGDINIGGKFGGGSVATNPQLNAAVSNGNINRSTTTNGAVSSGSGTVDDGSLYNGIYATGGGYGTGYGGGVGFTSDPISAYETAVDSGMANLIRAQGQYEVDDTHAAINVERARAKYIDNQQKYVYARQALKRTIAAAKTDDIEAHKAAREKQDEFLAAHRPQPLNHEDLDPFDGSIRWPAALMTSDFDDLRTSLNDSFAKKSRSYDRSAMASQIYKDIEEMQNRLHQQILKIPLRDYSEARIFLESMMASVR